MSLPTVAVSAPGKVLLAGGYLALDQKYTALVFGLSARINVIAGEIHTGTGVQLSEIIVDSPQFLQAQWKYGYVRTPDDGGIKVTQLDSGLQTSRNPFVETTLSYALTYIDEIVRLRSGSSHSIKSARLIILADNDYYSQPNSSSVTAGRFAKFPVPLSGANKTGLGSSAALVTALTASLLVHYLPQELFDITSDEGKRKLHNLAQAAHCAAQGKVGSGFDVAAAVFGTCRYRRFDPTILGDIPEPGAPSFGATVTSVVGKAWDTEVQKEGLRMPDGVALRLCDVDCGSQTVGMVKQVLSWRREDPDQANPLWDELQGRNDALTTALKEGKTGDLGAKVEGIRELIRKMSKLSKVPIEPESQTELLDALTTVEGVYGGVVPGAGGFDAVSILVKDDRETEQRMEKFFEQWSKEKGSKVRLLGVKGEMQGVRQETLDLYAGWL